ncbi:MAG: MptD family putative ECF transporter S component, partial [Bifidobacteriaceae bacterium]|jgi:energy-coupling factor transport system substrate-specific component|nr:MptD family putative ECF transporter S component [Bifidobacteriaceae bacterium]
LAPITQVLGPLYIPLVGGVVFMLFLTRVKAFGMISTMAVLVGLALLATGQGFWGLVFALALGPLADLIIRAGKYQSWTCSMLSYVVFSEILIATVIPLFFARNAFLAKREQRHGQEWAEQITALTPPWMFGVMMAMLAVGAVGGTYLGRALLKKHFERAGIA